MAVRHKISWSRKVLTVRDGLLFVLLPGAATSKAQCDLLSREKGRNLRDVIELKLIVVFRRGNDTIDPCR